MSIAHNAVSPFAGRQHWGKAQAVKPYVDVSKDPVDAAGPHMAKTKPAPAAKPTKAQTNALAARAQVQAATGREVALLTRVRRQIAAAHDVQVGAPELPRSYAVDKLRTELATDVKLADAIRAPHQLHAATRELRDGIAQVYRGVGAMRSASRDSWSEWTPWGERSYASPYGLDHEINANADVTGGMSSLQQFEDDVKALGRPTGPTSIFTTF